MNRRPCETPAAYATLLEYYAAHWPDQFGPGSLLFTVDESGPAPPAAGF